jgi:hypothetical protein
LILILILNELAASDYDLVLDAPAHTGCDSSGDDGR